MAFNSRLNAVKMFLHSRTFRFLIDFGVIFSISILVFRNFIFAGGWPGGGDVLTWVAREYLFGRDLRWLYIWRPYSFGFVEGVRATDFFLMLVNLLCKTGPATIKFYMYLTYIFAGFFMYILAYYFTSNNWAALSASLVYILNRWLFTQYTEAHVEILFGYAIVPLLFLLLDRALRFGKVKDLIALAIGLSICVTGFHLQSVVIYMFSFILFTLIYLLFHTREIALKNRLENFIKVYIFSGGMILLLCFFYLVPMIYNLRPQYLTPEFGHVLEESYTNSYANMFKAFTLNGLETWGYIYVVDVVTEVSLQILPVSMILFIIFFIAYATVIYKTDRYKLYFFILGLGSVFIAKGPHPPFKDIFIWAWFEVPFFNTFRSANRALMITSLCHAFYIAVLVNMIIGFIKKRKSVENMKNSGLEKVDKHETQNNDSENGSLHRFTQWIKKVSYYLSVFLFILILLSGILSSWFFLTNGLQVYHPPGNFISPYEWIASKEGDFKIVSASRSPSEWQLLPYSESDFAVGGMLTSLGWGHDIGQLSTFIHDKPLLHDGGWEQRSRAFVDHLRYREVRNSLTDQLLKILGIFNYKYIVLPPYTSESVRSFFMNQTGGQVVYNQSGSIIMENTFHQPRMFSASTPFFVVGGGFKSLFTMSKIPYFNFTPLVPFFVNERACFNLLKTNSDDSSILLFDDTDLMELVMLSSDKIDIIPAARYGASSRNYTSYWAGVNSWRTLGLSTRATLTTWGTNRVSIPFEVEEDGEHDVLVHLGFKQHVGELAVHIDAIPIGKIYPKADSWTSIKWINLGSIHLEKGRHQISLTNVQTGWNDVDAVAVVKSSVLGNQINETLEVLGDYPGRIIHVLNGANTFTHKIPPGWALIRVPNQGFMLRSSLKSTPLETNTTIFREGEYMFSIRLAKGLNKGFPQLSVDNKTIPLRLYNSSNNVQLYEGGPIYLNASSYPIELVASESVVFDQMMIYSLKNEEKIVPLNGFELHTEDPGLNISPKGNTSASSVGVWGKISLDANLTNDGNNRTRWASRPHEKMPQWLQIEWTRLKELKGVRILFEEAYADDYAVQTWDGANWINQTRITDNTLLDRNHTFPAVNMTKLRIYVTNVTRLYDMVSIWELEAYTTPTVSMRVLIPEEGNYRAGFYLTSGPGYGTLNLKMGDTITTISCNSSIHQFRRHEIGPIYLRAGEQNVTLTAVGKVDFANMVMTFDDEGAVGYIDNFIESKPTPHVTYEKKNPCMYKVKVEGSNAPSLLIFSESYHQLWKAYVGEEEISPHLGYGMINIFPIERSGDFDMTIYFTGQKYADIGIRISTAALVLLVTLLIISLFTKNMRSSLTRFARIVKIR